MAYEVVKIVNGRPYRYLQRSYRENGRVRTESIYLGPLEPRRRRGLQGFVRDLVGKKAWKESEKEREAWMKEQRADMAKRDRINDLLTTRPFTLDAMKEVAALQQPAPPSFSAPEPITSTDHSPNAPEPPASQ